MECHYQQGMMLCSTTCYIKMNKQYARSEKSWTTSKL